MRKDTYIHIRIDSALKERAREHAKKLNMSLSEFILFLIRNELCHHTRDDSTGPFGVMTDVMTVGRDDNRDDTPHFTKYDFFLIDEEGD